MAACAHQYPSPHPPCLHAAVEGSDVCLWHNPKVRKHDAYVPTLLESADLTGNGDLDGFHLVGLTWPNAILPGRSLRHADLRDAVLDGAELSAADFTGAVLRRASFKRARLAKAVLVGVDLSQVNLSGADLREADLRRAVLNATVLNGADLSGADLGEATVNGFSWNEKTRFAGIRGMDDPGFASEDDDTRHCAAPLAAGASAVINEVSALDEPDPDREATRSFAISIPTARPSSAPPTRPWALTGLAVAAGLVLGALACWAVRPTSTVAPQAELSRLAEEKQALSQQGEAYAARIHDLEDGAKELLDQQAATQHELLQAKTENDRLREASRRSSGEAARLRGADDHAALLRDELERRTSEHARVSANLARQMKLSTILAEGVQHLTSEAHQATLKSEELGQAASQVPLLAKELSDTKDALRRITEERDAWHARATSFSDDLTNVRGELTRYLARVHGTGMQDYLTSDTDSLPLVALQPGQPIALGGDYCLTLRVDPGQRTGTVQAALTVQRPSALANPDIAVLLYDHDRTVLRRIAWSFPHVDGGAPVVTASSIVGCDRFPTYVRVMLSPAVKTAQR